MFSRPSLRSDQPLAGALLGLALLVPADAAAAAPATGATSTNAVQPATTADAALQPTAPAQPATSTTSAQPGQPTPPQPEVAPTVAPSPEAPPEDLLGPSVDSQPQPSPLPPDVGTSVDPLDDEDLSDEQLEARATFFHNLYRPEENPGRFNVVVTSNFTVLGSNDHHLSGRFFGLGADIGQSWNTMGYALSLRANVGNLNLREDHKVQAVALIGGGPSLNLGRLALLQRGYLDLRVGYDFYYAPARAITDDVVAESITPHGPRLQLNMGLMVRPGRVGRFFHGVGATVGYQALVGAFSGDLPFTSMLSFGLSYWMG